MVIKSFFVLLLCVLVNCVKAGGVEYVETKRIYTPTPFVPSMMLFSVNYMLNNDMFELNKFEFYNSYMDHGRLLTVDKLAVDEYKRLGEQCSKNQNNELSAKALSACGRVVAALYVESHNIVPQTFGFKTVILEVVPDLKNGAFFFIKDGDRVHLNRASDFGIKKNKRYLVEMNLSSYGDYDLREVGVPFNYEAYLISVKKIK
ncbi:hypothetical protein [Cellvibrio japonicus]|uniref:hypothetical protein n=1 Tax=Cellvibrio japonicus TaxID=155077 RepID=UPI0005A0B4CF|nr:hypothetical protein [Cellvibrio japonicus]QEI12991.1 hypothetical protein FY117_12675 [Cellvibrio japonicus]QEI16565.1 hypothetical protein FY116_12680 [Cellvibrio japonicus]QEI20143.1 hypothetical protein FY115_12675 [Cellvibrio japonicus]